MRIVCQQTILMKYHALFFLKPQNWKCHLLQIIGGALCVKSHFSAITIKKDSDQSEEERSIVCLFCLI